MTDAHDGALAAPEPTPTPVVAPAEPPGALAHIADVGAPSTNGASDLARSGSSDDGAAVAAGDDGAGPPSAKSASVLARPGADSGGSADGAVVAAGDDGAGGDSDGDGDGASKAAAVRRRRRGSRGGRNRSGRPRQLGAAGDATASDDDADDGEAADDDGEDGVEADDRPVRAAGRSDGDDDARVEADDRPVRAAGGSDGDGRRNATHAERASRRESPDAVATPAADDARPESARPALEDARLGVVADSDPDLPDPPGEGRVSDPLIAERALVRKPQIGDTRPAPAAPAAAVPTRGRQGGAPSGAGEGEAAVSDGARKRRRGGRGRGKPGSDGSDAVAGGRGGGNAGGVGSGGPGGGVGGQRGAQAGSAGERAGRDRPVVDGGRRSGAGRQGGRSGGRPVETISPSAAIELDAETLERRRGRERNGRPVGRYLMCVHVRPELTQIAVLEGRSLIEHYVARPADDVAQIHGNIYMGKVQNVLPGMEAAFVDIATPKNAVLYRGDVTYDSEDVESSGGGRGKVSEMRIEQMLKPRQLIVCQVTKNPIGAKGARLTQEVSLPGRFVVLIPNSKTYGISKRLPDDERKRLRAILDQVKPAHHGVIVRTAAENVVAEELRADVERLLRQWEQVEALARKTNGPKLLYREPDLAVRVIREEFNANYRGIVIDDRALYEEVRDYVTAFNPTLADRVAYYDPETEGLPIFEKHHVHEQVHKALDRKVWLPSGGSLIIEHTEALTVIDVNTGKNVGTTNLEETVYRNNLEAAEEIARQLRLRDIGGIIVIDFIDMEIKENRFKVVTAFRDALSRDKTRSQVFEISDLGLVEMTRKRIGEGLLTAFTDPCPICEGRGVRVDHALID